MGRGRRARFAAAPASVSAALAVGPFGHPVRASAHTAPLANRPRGDGS
ncbi:hypothetical protein ACGFWD_04055 [Streptomyces sp. NPDC048448]